MRVVIVQNFEGYPDGPDKPSRYFVAAKDAIDVPDDFGALIVQKGHAVAAGGTAAPASASVVAVSEESHASE